MENIFPHLDSSTDSMTQVLMQTALYGYVLFVAADMIGEGAELLLLVQGWADIVGSIVLPVLGAVPDGMMVLCSGLGPDPQGQVSVGVGALAGSTIMLLTLPWFLSIYAGRVDIKNGDTMYKGNKLTPPTNRSLFHTGVKLGGTIASNASVMLLTCSPFIIVQGPAFLVNLRGSLSARAEQSISHQERVRVEHPFACASLVLSWSLFLWYLLRMYHDNYCADGAVTDTIVNKMVQSIQEGKLTLRQAMQHFTSDKWEMLCNEGREDLKTGSSEQDIRKIELKPGSPAEEEVRKMCRLLIPFYRLYDTNRDNRISLEEFRMILVNLREKIGLGMQKRLFNAVDEDRNGYINFQEFVTCMIAFSLERDAADFDDEVVVESPRLHPERIRREKSGTENGSLASSQEDPEEEEEDMPDDLSGLSPEEQQRRLKARALYSMTIGTVLVLVFSDPMTDMLGLIGELTGVPKFYVSFVLAPLASNASELVSAMKLAQKKTIKSMTQSLSTLEGAAIMNNTFCLGIFLILIVWKRLEWKFCAETVSIVTIQVLIAFMAISKPIHRLFDGIIILMFYPLALFIVWALENLAGLD